MRVLQSGIGAHDATSFSPDHAVAIDFLLRKKSKFCAVLKLFVYGGNAICGIVDVNDHRIPEKRAKKPISGFIENRYDKNGDGINSAFK